MKSVKYEVYQESIGLFALTFYLDVLLSKRDIYHLEGTSLRPPAQLHGHANIWSTSLRSCVDV